MSIYTPINSQKLLSVLATFTLITIISIKTILEIADLEQNQEL